MQYFEAPAEVIEEREAMQNWVEKAVIARQTKTPNPYKASRSQENKLPPGAGKAENR
jgi:hypothetical protein